MKISIVVLAVLALSSFGNGKPMSSSKLEGFLNACNGQYLCSNKKSTSRTFKRIDRSKLCNGFGDCPNSDDELDCPCKPLAVPLNGKVKYTGDTRYTLTAFFSCDPRFKLEGATSRNCVAPGKWSGESPTCMAIGCGPLADPKHGTVNQSDGTQLSSVALYECDAGYENIGGASTTCQAHGFWDETCPTCTLIDCHLPPKDAHGYFKVLAGPQRVGVSAYLECYTGYVVEPAVVIKCLPNGLWSMPDHYCKSKGCGPLADPEHGTVKQSYETQLYSVAYYECDEGYENIGGTFTTCQAHGFWEKTCPTCTLIDCHLLPEDAHGCFNVAVGPHRVGATAYLECDPGYVVEPAVVIKCNSSGYWSPPAYSCQPRVCEAILPTDVNGHFSTCQVPVPTFGSIAILICDPLFDVDECDRYITCLEDGSWSDPKAQCSYKCDGDYKTTVTCTTTPCVVPGASLLIQPIILLTELSPQCAEDNGYQLGANTNSIMLINGCQGVFQVCGCTNDVDVMCSSYGFAYDVCAVPGAEKVIHMEVKTKVSTAACILWDGYGFAGNNIWVNKGCRATFHVCYK